MKKSFLNDSILFIYLTIRYVLATSDYVFIYPFIVLSGGVIINFGSVSIVERLLTTFGFYRFAYTSFN